MGKTTKLLFGWGFVVVIYLFVCSFLPIFEYVLSVSQMQSMKYGSFSLRSIVFLLVLFQPQQLLLNLLGMGSVASRKEMAFSLQFKIFFNILDSGSQYSCYPFQCPAFCSWCRLSPTAPQIQWTDLLAGGLSIIKTSPVMCKCISDLLRCNLLSCCE